MPRPWEPIEGNAPPWVLSAEERIRSKHGGTSSSLRDRYFIVKGRHFEYRLSFGGQGGYNTYIERRKRG